MPKLEDGVISFFVEELFRSEKFQESWDIRASQPIQMLQDEEEYEDFIQFYESWLLTNGLFKRVEGNNGECNVITEKGYEVYYAGGWAEFTKKQSEALRNREVTASERGTKHAKSAANAAWLSVIVTIILAGFNVYQAKEIDSISNQLKDQQRKISNIESSSFKITFPRIYERQDSARLSPTLPVNRNLKPRRN